MVCPSLPGYGFSGPTRERGWDPERIAKAEVELMRRLGYARYGAQGGDWGSVVTSWIGKLDPAHCAGIHLNMLIAPPPPGREARGALARGAASASRARARSGARAPATRQIQGTKPQTLAYGLTDSPAGLAGWIVEKFRAWSDCKGDVESVFTRDELLTNIMVYWVTGTINSSTRLYYEMRKSAKLPFADGRIEVPTGVAVFPKELVQRAARVGGALLRHPTLVGVRCRRSLRGAWSGRRSWRRTCGSSSGWCARSGRLDAAELARDFTRWFALDGECVAVAPLKRGHIHDTLVGTWRTGEGTERIVLQRVNTHVFRDPIALMRDLAARHRARARSARPRGHAGAGAPLPARDPHAERRAAPRPTSTARSGAPFAFIEGARSFDVPDSPVQAEEAARAFGAFASQLADLDPATVAESIPRFHDFAHRLAALEAAIAADAHGATARGPRGRRARAAPRRGGRPRARERGRERAPAPRRPQRLQAQQRPLRRRHGRRRSA